MKKQTLKKENKVKPKNRTHVKHLQLNQNDDNLAEGMDVDVEGPQVDSFAKGLDLKEITRYMTSSRFPSCT
jgi:hypothetical protein